MTMFTAILRTALVFGAIAAVVFVGAFALFSWGGVGAVIVLGLAWLAFG